MNGHWEQNRWYLYQTHIMENVGNMPWNCGKIKVYGSCNPFFIGKLQMHLVGLEPSISCNPAKHTFFLCNGLRPSYEIPKKKKKSE